MVYMKLADKIPMLVKLRGTTQADLAKAIGTYPQRISEWIGERGSPSLYQALRMARALGVSLDYLADDDQDEPPALLTDRERQVWEIVREIGPEKAWKRLVGSEPLSAEPRLLPPPTYGIKKEETA